MIYRPLGQEDTLIQCPASGCNAIEEGEEPERDEMNLRIAALLYPSTTYQQLAWMRSRVIRP